MPRRELERVSRDAKLQAAYTQKDPEAAIVDIKENELTICASGRNIKNVN